jgi:hypothetical protein
MLKQVRLITSGEPYYIYIYIYIYIYKYSIVGF